VTPRPRAFALLAVLVVAAACGAGRESPPPSPPPPVSPAARAPAAAACRRDPSPACAAGAPATIRDVAPILERRCFACHAGDGAAADEHDFSNRATVFAQRGAIAREVSACAMPPPRAPALPDDEAATILRWATCGAREE